MADVNQAFPPGSLRSPESALFCSLAQAEREIRAGSATPRLALEHGEAARAIEIAPLVFGGLDWLATPSLARGARLAFCQAMADAAAQQVRMGPALGDDDAALRLLFKSLSFAAGIPWYSPPPIPTGAGALAAGHPRTWLIAVAARDRLLMAERWDIEKSCAKGAPSSRPARL